MLQLRRRFQIPKLYIAIAKYILDVHMLQFMVKGMKTETWKKKMGKTKIGLNYTK